MKKKIIKLIDKQLQSITDGIRKLEIRFKFNDFYGKLARLWTYNSECQGSNPIQVNN